MPKVGFKSKHTKLDPLNVGDVELWLAMGRLEPAADQLLTLRDLADCGLVSRKTKGVKLLGGDAKYPRPCRDLPLFGPSPLRGISASWPRRRRDPPPRKTSHGVAATRLRGRLPRCGRDPPPRKTSHGITRKPPRYLTQPIHLEVSRASASAIAAVEAAGGTVTCAHYNRLALRALMKPDKFLGPLPRRARPPPRLMRYYVDGERRGEYSPHVQLRNRRLGLQKRGRQAATALGEG